MLKNLKTHYNFVNNSENMYYHLNSVSQHVPPSANTKSSSFTHKLKLLPTFCSKWTFYVLMIIFVLVSYLPRFQYCFGFSYIAGGLECGVPLRVSVKHTEEIIVGASHDRLIVTRPAAFELIEDTIIFVQRAQLWPQVFVNLKNSTLYHYKNKVKNVFRYLLSYRLLWANETNSWV